MKRLNTDHSYYLSFLQLDIISKLNQMCTIKISHRSNHQKGEQMNLLAIIISWLTVIWKHVERKDKKNRTDSLRRIRSPAEFQSGFWCLQKVSGTLGLTSFVFRLRNDVTPPSFFLEVDFRHQMWVEQMQSESIEASIFC